MKNGVYVGACRCLSVFVGACRCMSVFVGACRCLSVRAGVCRCLSVCVSVCRCVSVCVYLLSRSKMLAWHKICKLGTVMNLPPCRTKFPIPLTYLQGGRTESNRKYVRSS